VRAQEKASSHRDKRFGTVYSVAPLRCDDLTQIQGIDDDLHSQLNALGVYTFKQVMEWSSQVTAAFSQQLATDGILKEDWIGQARRLYHRHYPAAA
jgi:predicted flap endonuclease-1-like 5' DNA nuclease